MSAAKKPKVSKQSSIGAYFKRIPSESNSEKPATSEAVRVELDPGQATTSSGYSATEIQQDQEDTTGKKHVSRWSEQFRWMQYDTVKSVAFCNVCRWAVNSNRVTPDTKFAITRNYPVWVVGFTDWGHGKCAATRHDSSSLHKECANSYLQQSEFDGAAKLISEKSKESMEKK